MVRTAVQTHRRPGHLSLIAPRPRPRTAPSHRLRPPTLLLAASSRWLAADPTASRATVQWCSAPPPPPSSPPAPPAPPPAPPRPALLPRRRLA